MARMTKKHYEAFAAAIAGSDMNRYYRGKCAEIIADVCENYDPGFDRARFYALCGLDVK